jgi:hypothetical protein
MATGSVIKHRFDCTVSVSDGTPSTPLTQSFGLFNGNVSISGLNRKLRNVVEYKTRDGKATVRHTDRNNPTFSLQFHLANWSGAVDAEGNTEVSPFDVFNAAGAWSSAVSTIPTSFGGSDVFGVDITITLEGTELGEGSDHTLTFTRCVGICSADISEPGTWTVEVTCYGDTSGDITLA